MLQNMITIDRLTKRTESESAKETRFGPTPPVRVSNIDLGLQLGNAEDITYPIYRCRNEAVIEICRSHSDSGLGSGLIRYLELFGRAQSGLCNLRECSIK